ncbi:hypothetical protein Tco_1389287, partial [Tanacetum coccineum]
MRIVGHKEEMWLVLWPRNGLEMLVSCLGMKECTLPTEGMRSIISTVSISLEGFLPSILFLLMIIVAVVIVAVILVVLVVAIVGMAIVVTIIGVVVEITIIGIV